MKPGAFKLWVNNWIREVVQPHHVFAVLRRPRGLLRAPVDSRDVAVQVAFVKAKFEAGNFFFVFLRFEAGKSHFGLKV